MDLVFQREVEGKVLDVLVVVNLHPGRVLIGLKVFDDIRKPHRQPIVPGHKHGDGILD